MTILECVGRSNAMMRSDIQLQQDPPYRFLFKEAILRAQNVGSTHLAFPLGLLVVDSIIGTWIRSQSMNSCVRSL